MIKSKNKILITLCLIAVLMLMLAVVSSAKEITVKFYNGDKIDASFGNNGELYVDTEVGFTLPGKEVEKGYSFNWYTSDGRAWSAGSFIKLDEDTELKQVIAQDVSDATTFAELLNPESNHNVIRLISDLTITSQLVLNWYARPIILMNGHTINITGTHERAISGQRAGPSFYGIGDINFNTTHTDSVFAYLNSHNYRGNESVLFIGRDVTINAPKATLLKDTDGATSQGYPHIIIYGTVDCKTVMNIGNTNERQPNIDINEGAQLIVRGKLLENSANTIKVNVRGGTITMKSADFSFFRDADAVYKFSGGVIEFSYESDPNEVNDYVVENYKAIKLKANNIEYRAIVPSNCAPNKSHSFVLKEKHDATCASYTSEEYACQNCEHTITIKYGSKAAHDFQLVSSTPATKEELGQEKHVCNDCQGVEIIFTPYDTIPVVVLDGENKKVVQIALNQVFEYTKGNTGYTITDVKATTEYTIDKIVGIYIPVGVIKVNLKTANTYVKELIIDDGANVTITSVSKLEALETITIKKCTVTFNAKCTAKSLKTVDSSVEGATVIFGKEAFTGVGNLTTLNMCLGSTYSFAQDSFKQVGIKKLVFQDNLAVTFEAVAPFYESKIEELYVGKGIKTFSYNSTFENCDNLKKIVLMDITELKGSTFKNIADDAVVYHHGASLSVAGDTFGSNKNITIYTKAGITDGGAFNGCTGYTIHYGLCHAYTKQTSEASCTQEGGVKYVVSDCPCGVSETAIYKLFKNNVTSSGEYEVIYMLNETTSKLAHSLTTLIQIRYDNGYTEYGTGVYKCTSCTENIDEDEPTHAPIVRALGYSVSEAGAYSISSRYHINRDSLSDYININSGTLEIGVVMGLRSVLGTSTPLNESGVANKGAMKRDLTSQGYTVYETLLKGIPESCLDDNYIIAIYIIDNGEVNYVQSNATVENPSGVNYNELYDILHYVVADLPASLKDED